MSDTIIKMTGGVIRQQKNTILKNVNIEIKSGEFIYLIGKVGSGKSSFLKTLYAELPLEYGTGEVAEFQLKKIKKSQIPLLRRKCGIVFQDFKLLIDRDVYANLEFVLRATGWINKKAIRERIETVLAKVEMIEKQNKMPHQLSGGEQQRIVLARALLNAPPIILADEPTGNIDPETSYRLIELLKEICDTGKTIIIATHQYDLIEKYPGRVLCCSDGELFEKCSLVTNQTNITEISTEISTENIDLPEITEEIPSIEEPSCISGMVEVIDNETETTITAIEAEESVVTVENSPEEETDSLLEPLTFPEVVAFDYEADTELPLEVPGKIETITEQTEEKISNIPAPIEEIAEVITSYSEIIEEPEEKAAEETVPEEIVPEEEVVATPRTRKKKSEETPKSPTFDLELD